MPEIKMIEESIFLNALDIKSEAERAAYLDNACGENLKLRGQVEALLIAHRQSNELLDLPDGPGPTFDKGDSGPAVSNGDITVEPGEMIGAHKLLEQIGEGGFGVVFMAEQTEPVKRKVALKLLKPGMDTKQVVARFEAERQALALMDHPNIAHVYDAGATESGRPYFVMELVKGVPITKYCDEKNSTPKSVYSSFSKSATPSSTPIKKESFTAILSQATSSFPPTMANRS